ncbi:similar to replication protein A 30kDa [Cyanidioschyzon merolae strain 10D]|uniref:Similar to replication protein A 30kDa n=1 Tax=Cyanidioschyzon merolae (strain NIES-3377 / 10D) TaxID=280699 RepID=M1V568_CYAM1|nr:similar to replication protein A 30kDa [Cyanidioschyzon merolae strain 10D]BAM80145.1 similar to replication protein A 30kDa [Cyanidioschyzon merolae strain 10D]|eukprot:XP_005536431.1 similar to replication protein A 30kDa [Cyanidioschyzon merolae strain 10D]
MDYSNTYGAYGGGGFLPESPARTGGNASTRFGVGSGSSLRDQRRSLLPVRVADLVHAVHDPVTNTFVLRDENEHQSITISEGSIVKVVAYVEELREQPLDLLWLLDDRSGEMIWARMASTSSSSLAALEQSGILVRVFGQLLEVDGRRVLNVRAIRKADGEVELRYHENLCQLSKLQLIRGYPTAGNALAGASSSPASPKAGPSKAVHRSSLGSGAPKEMAQQAPGLEIPAAFPPEHFKVLKCIREETARNRDAMLTDIAQRIALSTTKVRGICDALQNEGHIYCTLDDDTFRASSS